MENDYDHHLPIVSHFPLSIFHPVMTKSRISADRVLLGILGTSSTSSVLLREWNRFLRNAGIDGSMDRYPCTAAALPECLSAMVHFDRRGYIVTRSLQKEIIVLMDRLDSSAVKRNAVDTVVNDGGVLVGYFLDNDAERRRDVWLT